MSITKKIPRRLFFSFCLLFLSPALFAAQDASTDASKALWPPITKECKPWAYHWWMGSAVDPEGIAWNFKQHQEAGMGGMHIVPIYGVKGYEDKFIPYMSPKWLEMLDFAIKEAEKNDMGIDMTLGTGWCFGGPMIPLELSCMRSETKVEKQPDGTEKIVLEPKYTHHNVKRSAPGGEGFMLDPFSQKAIDLYLKWFQDRFADYKGPYPRSFYHDSYEYYNSWSNEIYEQFEKRRGYRLQDELSSLAGRGDRDKVERVKGDFRRTVAEMHYDFLKTWVDWCHSKGSITRNQAHGSPSNILDTYGVADIPETEFFRLVKSAHTAKFASSPAHVLGKNLVASETGTWMEEHFQETLGDMKVLVDTLFISGINHVFYHGTVYSPQNEDWPGWSFYASTQMNPRNSIWNDAVFLNEYIARCQSVLQAGKSDNDILLYWPVEDLWHSPRGTVLPLSVHTKNSWLNDHPIGKTAVYFQEKGFQYDYISDKQVLDVRFENGKLLTSGGTEYRAIFVPRTRHVPLETAKKWAELAERGAPILFEADFPEEVPGWFQWEKRQDELRSVAEKARKLPSIQRNILETRDAALESCGVRSETAVREHGLKLIRRSLPDGEFYFLTNFVDGVDPKEYSRSVESWIPLERCADEKTTPLVVFMDPMSGKTGKAAVRTNPETKRNEIFLQLAPNASIIVRLLNGSGKTASVSDWAYYRPEQKTALEPAFRWEVEFLRGGPELPKKRTVESLKSWTEWGDASLENFGGTAKYTTTFDLPIPKGADETYRLDLGTVCESVRIRFNGEELGCVFVAPYTTVLPKRLLKEKGNRLELEITNLSANRIRDLDRRQVPWKKFLNINVVNVDYKALDASNWPLFPGGLIGPVRLIPVVSTTP